MKPRVTGKAINAKYLNAFVKNILVGSSPSWTHIFIHIGSNARLIGIRTTCET
jgi:hypothetical protein